MRLNEETEYSTINFSQTKHSHGINTMNLTQIVGLVLVTIVVLNAQLSAQQPNKTTPQSQIADSALEPAKPKRYAIAIHGGAGSNPKIFSDAQNDRRRASMQQALQIGNDILKNGGSSLDAVEQVVRFLENCLLYTSPSPRDGLLSRMPSSA